MRVLANAWTPDQWILVITAVIGSLTAAVTGIIAALHGQKTNQQLKAPSNGVTSGSLQENTAINLSTLVHLIAEEFNKQVSVPTPRETQAQLPGSTLADPPPLPKDKPPT